MTFFRTICVFLCSHHCILYARIWEQLLVQMNSLLLCTSQKKEKKIFSIFLRRVVTKKTFLQNFPECLFVTLSRQHHISVFLLHRKTFILQSSGIPVGTWNKSLEAISWINQAKRCRMKGSLGSVESLNLLLHVLVQKRTITSTYGNYSSYLIMNFNAQELYDFMIMMFWLVGRTYQHHYFSFII